MRYKGESARESEKEKSKWENVKNEMCFGGEKDKHTELSSHNIIVIKKNPSTGSRARGFKEKQKPFFGWLCDYVCYVRARHQTTSQTRERKRASSSPTAILQGGTDGPTSVDEEGIRRSRKKCVFHSHKAGFPRSQL